MPHQHEGDPKRQEELATNPNRRVRRIVVWASCQEYDLLKKHAAARGKGLGPYLRALGLRQQASMSVYIELARKMLAIGHAIIEVLPDRTEERERLLARVRPLLRQISAHLP